MSDWVVRKVDEVAELLDNRRVPVNEEERAARRGNVPYYGANGLQGFINKPLFDEPLILLAEDGGNFDDFDKRPIAYRIAGPSWVNNHAHVLRSRPGTDQDFLFYALEHKDIRRWIKGGTRGKLNGGDLKRVEVHLPLSCDEQRRIADLLSAVDEQLAVAQQRVQKLVARRQGLVQTLVLPTAMASEATTIGQASSLVTSGSRGWASYYSKEGAVFLRIGNLTREHPNLRMDDVVRVRVPQGGEGARTKLEKGDLLISITADLGIIGCVPPNLGEAYVNQHIALARIADPDLDPRWAAHVLASPYGFQQIARLNDGGAKAGLNLPTIRALRVPKPAPDMQKRIAQLLDEADAEIAAEREVSLKLTMQKRGLMASLLSSAKSSCTETIA